MTSCDIMCKVMSIVASTQKCSQASLPFYAISNASDDSDSPMIGQQNVFPDSIACSFPEAAVSEVSIPLGNPLLHTPITDSSSEGSFYFFLVLTIFRRPAIVVMLISTCH